MDDLTRELAADAARLSTAPDAAQLNELQRMGRELAQLERDIAQQQEQLAALTAQRTELTTRTLPDFMMQLGVDRVGLVGEEADVVCRPYYHASVPKDRADEAHEWLEQNGFGDLIKCTVTASFGKEQLVAARWLTWVVREAWEHLVEAMSRQGDDADELNDSAPQSAELKRGVHFATLTSWLREQHEKNQDLPEGEEPLSIPLELLGATIGRVVEIKQRQNAKRRR